MSAFQKSLLFFIVILFFIKPEFVYALDSDTFSFTTSQAITKPGDSIFENKKTISDQTISEIKKSQILLVIVITFFVFGFLFLIYHLKKVSIINQQLESYSKENEFLISETNHRVNNNLQLISLLISETLRKKQSEDDKNDFMRLQTKVDSIALLHRHLYKGKNVNSINLGSYLNEVKNNFNLIESEQQLTLDFQIDAIEVQSENAMYLGLLVTELIINSVKYAFKDEQLKNINIEIKKIQSQFEFSYSDNGQKNNSQEIHPVLVKQLCQQIGVNPIMSIENGFHLSFTKSIENA